MVNNTDERPINPLAAGNWDLRRKEKASQQANEQSKQQALREVSKAASRGTGGKESRTDMTTSGLVNAGKKEKKSGSW